MRMFRGLLMGLCCYALSAFGFAVAASAAQISILDAVHFSVADVGVYGAESAKLNAQLAAMDGSCCTSLKSGALMTSESNGFRMAEMTKSGVAKGMTGIGSDENYGF